MALRIQPVSSEHIGTIKSVSTDGHTLFSTLNPVTITAEMFLAVGDGVTDDSAAIQAALDSATGVTVLLTSGKTYKIGTGLSVPANATLSGYGATITTTATITAITLAGSSSAVKGVTINGPSSSYVENQKAIYATGTQNGDVGQAIPPTYLTGISIDDVTIDSFGNYGIELLYCEGYIKKTKITNCGYSGILGYACKNLHVVDYHCDTLVGETTSGELNAYGVTFTGLAGATDIVRDPPSTDCSVINSYIANVPDWHGLDTHGGLRIKFIGNTIKDCRRGIVLTGRGVAGGSTECLVEANILSNELSGDNSVGNEKTAAAIWDVGASTGKSGKNSIIGNKIFQFGGITTNVPAVWIENTEDGSFKNNVLIQPYTTGIKTFIGAKRYDISNNTIIDPKGTGISAGGPTDFPQCITISDTTNTGITVSNNTLTRKDTSAATKVGEIGINVLNIASKTVHFENNTFDNLVADFSLGADQTGLTGDVRGSFTGTLTGCTTSPTVTIDYLISNKIGTLHIPNLTATSNTTACTITGAPSCLFPATQKYKVARIRDNGTDAFGTANIETTGVITLFTGAGLGAFTNSGEKGLRVSTLTYSLD